VERPERGAHPGRAGNLPARTNDIDLDERRKTLTGPARGEEAAGTRGFDRLHESTPAQDTSSPPPDYPQALRRWPQLTQHGPAKGAADHAAYTLALQRTLGPLRRLRVLPAARGPGPGRTVPGLVPTSRAFGAVRCRARCAAVRQAPLQYLAGRPPREAAARNGSPHR